MRTDILVTYDVQTTDPEGKRRLRRVAKVCEAYGQRVQYSVFECSVTPAQFEQMRRRLLREIEATEDSLRFYRLNGDRLGYLETYGRDRYVDFSDPLIY